MDEFSQHNEFLSGRRGLVYILVHMAFRAFIWRGFYTTYAVFHGEEGVIYSPAAVGQGFEMSSKVFFSIVLDSLHQHHHFKP